MAIDNAKVKNFLKELGEDPANVVEFQYDPEGYNNTRSLDDQLNEDELELVQDLDKCRAHFGLRQILPSGFIFP